MKKQNKWLDNFGKADNANDSNVSLPEGFVGLGYDTKGRNYSPAWGGQFKQGGIIPIAQNGVSEYMKKKIKEKQDESIAAQYDLPEVVVQGFRDPSPFEQSGRMPKYTPSPTVPYLEKTKDPAEFFKSWITSPEYRRRKIETDYPEYAEYSPVTGDEIDDPYKGPLIDRAMRNNFLKLEQIQRPGAITYDPKRRSEYFVEGEANVNPKDFAGDVNTVKAHEIAHAVDTNVEDLSNEELKLLTSATEGWAKKLPKNISPELWEKMQLAQHLEKPTELKADLNALRFLMYDKDIYDIRKGEKFTKEHLEKAKEKLKGNQSLDRTLMVTGDENLINLMNIIAKKDEELTPIAMGGMSIPGSVGFTYARVAGAAPSKGKYAKKTMASAQGGKQVQKGVDSTLENIFEIVDPTGVSSWDDVYQSYQKSGMSPETKFEIFGALPILGKVGKAGKLLGPALSAGQANKRLKTNAKLVSNVMQSIPYIGRGTDATQAVQQFSDVPFFPTAPPAGVGQFGRYAGMPSMDLEKKQYGGEIPSAQNGIMSPLLLAKNVLNYFYPSEEATSTVSAAPVEYKKGLTDELLKRQAYKESTFNPAAVSPAGYKGLTQIGEEVLTDYSKKKGGKKLDPFNPKDAVELQKFAMDDLYNASFINKPNQPDSVRIAKTLAAYNWGRGNLFNYLNEQKQKGIDIYESYDWLNDLPKETSDYVNKILLQEDQSFNKNYKRDSTNPKYKDVTSLYDKKKFGGDIPSAQNGQEMKFYQNGLDWKPKSMQDGGVQRISTSDPRYPELYKNRQVGAYYDGAYSLPDLPEVVVTGKDERLKEAMYEGSNKFGMNALGLMSAPQVVTMEALTGKQQTPSEAFGFQQTGGWLDSPRSFGKNLGNLAMDVVLDPVNLLGVGLTDDIARKTLKGASKKLASSADDVSKSFKSEIDWAKWNPDTPKYPELIKEYNKIEEATKKAGTWMKNPDGSIFKGTPEQFVQQNSKNFKKAFGDSKLLNPDGSPTIQYHGSAKKFDTFDESKFQLGDSGYSGKGIYTTPDKGKASSYSLSSKSIHKDGDYEPTIYELYGQGNNPISAEDLIKQNKDYDLFNFHRAKDWRGDVPLEEQMLDYDVAIRNQTRGIERVSPWHQATELVFPTNKQLKSAVGNVGFFDMTNPNIYKGLIPAGIATALTFDQQKNGGITKDNLGYWNPDNWGQPVEIDSNNITMEGVYEPLLGISDTGDTQLMQPGKNYKFKGKKVTEFPVAKLGINQLDAQPMKKLNQLLNFTNNPDKDNWLDKYN